MAIRLCMVFLAVAIVAIYGGASAPKAAHGQGPAVDLSVSFFRDTGTRREPIALKVFNHGSGFADGVKVVIENEEFILDADKAINDSIPTEIPVGRLVSGSSPYQVVWEVGKIPPKTGYRLTHFTELVDDEKKGPISENPYYYFIAVAENTAPQESSHNLHNNRAFFVSHRSSSQVIRPQADLVVEAVIAAEDRNPGGDVSFGIVARQIGSDHINPGTMVNVQLTPGLIYSTHTIKQTDIRGMETDDTDTSYDSNSGAWNIGYFDFQPPGFYRLRVTATIAAGAVPGEQCLTAAISSSESEFVPLDGTDVRANNAAKVCLGVPEPVSDGTVDLFTWYDCVEETAYPCDQKGDDDLQLLAVVEGDRIFQPSQITVHIPDATSRARDVDGNVVWSTAYATFPGCAATPPTCLPGGVNRTGPLLRFNTTLLDLRTVTDGTETPPDVDRWGTPDITYPDWERGYFKTEMSGPGKMATLDSSSNGPASEWGSSDVGYEGNPWITSGDKHIGYTDDFYIEFSTLGTYELTATIRTPYDDDVTDTTDGVEHSDKETYTFHVGPISDLELSAGRPGGEAGGRWAFTVNAASNGPDQVLGAVVDVDLDLPGDVEVVDYVASDGTYANGRWDLGALRRPDYRRLEGIPGAATLTIILEGDRAQFADATATIKHDNTNHPYAVTIDGARHEGTVYDHNPGNNKVTLRAQRGTGGGAGGSPGRRASDFGRRRAGGGAAVASGGAAERLRGVPLPGVAVGQPDATAGRQRGMRRKGVFLGGHGAGGGTDLWLPGAGGERAGRGGAALAHGAADGGGAAVLVRPARRRGSGERRIRRRWPTPARI